MTHSRSAVSDRPMRVAVVGGGPAGAFFAYCLCRETAAGGRRTEVTVFEPKTFERRGAPHCNYCQGVISAGLLAEMKKLGLWIPEQVIRARIRSYGLVTLGGEVRLPVPGGQHIFTVFRGHGPVRESAGAISFDQFLLDEAVDRGARLVSRAIAGVELTGDPAAPVLLTDREGDTYRADVVVGAFGVNSGMGPEFERLGFGYRTPRTDSALQAELHLDRPDDGESEGGEIRIFALGLQRVRFAVITPKRSYATVSLVGEGLDGDDLEAFLTHPQVRNRIARQPRPANALRCSCAPRMPVEHGGELAAAHVMLIGDAAVSRYYKNGIESALRSAELAARVLARCDASDGETLRRWYSRRVKRIFRLDNMLGGLLFRLHDRIYRWPSVAAGYLALARGDYGITGHSRRKIRWILWNMFTGDSGYTRIFLNCLDPVLLARIVWVSLKIRLSRHRKRAATGEPDVE